ncbi:MAG TPA: hypothetical protein VK892_04125 [Pyrinomonadaceae bacterium]|nr:hypothetical protein [Pyrinomonadaceae bacterium]
MKVERRKLEKISLSIVVVFASVFALQVSVFAQGTRPMIPTDRRIEQINSQIQRSERDKLTREMKGENRSPENSKQNQAIKTQIKEDFESLQATYNKIVLNLQSGDIERGFVLEATADIKKFAARLKQNLALPKPETGAANENAAKDELNLNDRRKSLRVLCHHIYNFVTNPIFNEPTGIVIDQAVNAEREIDIIIELSEKIKEAAEKSTN